VDVDIFVSFFEAKSGKIEKLLGFFFVLVFQGVIPGATDDNEKCCLFPSLLLFISYQMPERDFRKKVNFALEREHQTWTVPR